MVKIESQSESKEDSVVIDSRQALVIFICWTKSDAGRHAGPRCAADEAFSIFLRSPGFDLRARVRKFGETVYDERTGHPINNNYADYLVAVNADVPEVECIFLNYPDPVINEYGARGVGEIGLTGCASAIAAATYHATGIRVRKLPIRLETLLNRAQFSHLHRPHDESNESIFTDGHPRFLPDAGRVSVRTGDCQRGRRNQAGDGVADA
jgi:hypothetical protein